MNRNTRVHRHTTHTHTHTQTHRHTCPHPLPHPHTRVQASLAHLHSLDTFGCPMRTQPRYRERVFEMLPQLQYLDGVHRFVYLVCSCSNRLESMEIIPKT